MSEFYEDNELVEYPDFIERAAELSDQVGSFEVGKYVVNVANEPKFIFMRFFDFTNMYEKLEELGETAAAVPHSITQGEQILLKIKSKFPFLSGMKNGEVLQVVTDVKLMNYKPKEIIFEQGEQGEEVYFIINGKVGISISTATDVLQQKTAKRVNIAVLPKLTIFGEMGPITKEKRSARATAVSASSILSFKIRDNENESTLKAFNKLKQNFIEILASKLIDTNKKLFSKS
jgi:CRP-like cAMP-binding protein